MIFFLINLFQLCLERLLGLVAQLSNDKPPVTYNYAIDDQSNDETIGYCSVPGGRTGARRMWNAPSKQIILHQRGNRNEQTAQLYPDRVASVSHPIRCLSSGNDGV